MERLEAKIDKILDKTNKLVTEVALVKQSANYTKKELEGNGKKGLIQNVEELSDSYAQLKTGMSKFRTRVDLSLSETSANIASVELSVKQRSRHFLKVIVAVFVLGSFLWIQESREFIIGKLGLIF